MLEQITTPQHSTMIDTTTGIITELASTEIEPNDLITEAMAEANRLMNCKKATVRSEAEGMALWLISLMV